jgi:hypothetical protein
MQFGLLHKRLQLANNNDNNNIEVKWPNIDAVSGISTCQLKSG